jgi:prepilin signal peptidase PulO-like enzyme (type II secretory pathway)
MLTFELMLFFSGLCVLSYHDARKQSVPARIIDPWCCLCVGIGICQFNFIQTATTAILLAALAYYAWLTRGIGSADIMVAAALGALFGPDALLCVIFLAALSGLIWALSLHQQRLAWIPHLLFGSVIVTLGAFLAPAVRFFLLV